MNWENLKQNICPKCNKDFYSAAYRTGNITSTRFVNGKYVAVLTHECGFTISENRMAQIVSSKVTQELQDKWDKEFERSEI
jgi:hypothetical protein